MTSKQLWISSRWRVTGSWLCFLLLFVTAATAADDETCTLDDCRGRDGDLEVTDDFVFDESASILTYLNPKILAHLPRIRRQLQDGKLVVIRDAFREDFANYAYNEINRPDLNWTLLQDGHSTGFNYHHHNIQKFSEDFTKTLWNLLGVFNHIDSKEFMTQMSGRDCTSPKSIHASPSYYQAGDYSMPHTDYNSNRTIAFVWHLTQNTWKPEWGGALYWCDSHTKHAFVHPSYNTLNLFSVTSHSTHFVTAVTQASRFSRDGNGTLIPNKRLAFNGWWETSFEQPTLEYPIEQLSDHEIDFLSLEMVQALDRLDFTPVKEVDPKRYERVMEGLARMRTRVWPPAGDEILYV